MPTADCELAGQLKMCCSEHQWSARHSWHPMVSDRSDTDGLLMIASPVEVMTSTESSTEVVKKSCCHADVSVQVWAPPSWSRRVAAALPLRFAHTDA